MNATQTRNENRKAALELGERRRLAMRAATDLIRQGYTAEDALAVVWSDDHVRSELRQWEHDWNECRLFLRGPGPKAI